MRLEVGEVGGGDEGRGQLHLQALPEEGALEEAQVDDGRDQAHPKTKQRSEEGSWKVREAMKTLAQPESSQPSLLTIRK